VIAFALALHLFAATASQGMPGATPPASGGPKFVQIATLTGIPADSSMRAEFVNSFRGVFALDELPGERLSSGDEWKPGLPLPNRFRLLEGEAASDAWTIDVEVGSPPPLHRAQTSTHAARTVATRRTSRGMIVAFVLHVPDPNGGPPRAVPQRFAFAFPAAGGGGGLAVPSTGYTFPWGDAGRVAGALALEALHRESGDIVDAERMDIQPAVRAGAGR
jgi:hypothetical protein